MDKSVIESFINNLKSAGVEKFMIRCEGGNRFAEHNTDSSRIFLQGDYALVLETKNNYGSDTGAFNVKAVPYDNIDDVTSFDLTTKEILDFLSAEGVTVDEDLKKFISTHGARVSVKPGSGNFGVPVDKDGKPILPNNKFPRVTQGTV